jgi:hypothetical protein
MLNLILSVIPFQLFNFQQIITPKSNPDDSLDTNINIFDKMKAWMLFLFILSPKVCIQNKISTARDPSILPSLIKKNHQLLPPHIFDGICIIWHYISFDDK